jgi:hypothetical protein
VLSINSWLEGLFQTVPLAARAFAAAGILLGGSIPAQGQTATAGGHPFRAFMVYGTWCRSRMFSHTA